ncbi:PadR family transcriptional regulator [Paenibacillus assamensis]|uniref:PadR family transcriptional regulator n=1 Tax=Paenibacillus assamensis TaxID=311244 RepID=UPI00040EDE76|nr:PadR family transcriptional regulator [Paenibacillus assamensis]
MSLKHGILGLLAKGSMTGYEINSDFNTSLNFMWNAQQSQVYRELNALEEKGLITSTTIQQEGRPNKKIYSILNSGLQELIEWINQYEFEESLKIRDAFVMRIFFSEHSDGSNLPFALHAYIEHHEALLNKLIDIEAKYIHQVEQQSDMLYWLISIRKGKFTFQANLNWARETLDLLDQYKGKEDVNHE